MRDNTAIPPSAVVTELLDYIVKGFTVEEGDILDCVVTEHRLQAFSPAYFTSEGRLFSYSEENCKAGRYVFKDRQVPASFISTGLPQPEEAWRKVNLEDLCRFFANPARFLINRRLGICLEERASLLEEKETFELEGLEKYLIEEDLVKKRLSGCQLNEVLPAIKATGLLPHGSVGECLLERLSRGVDRFVAKTGPYLATSTTGPKEVALTLPGFQITGVFPAVSAERLLQYRYAKTKAKDRLKLWIYHLVLNSLEGDGWPRTSLLVGLSGNEEWSAWEYLPVEGSEEILQRLLEAYWRGLVKPLRFFPESSWSYAERLLKKKKGRDHGLRGAHDAWTGSPFNRGEGEDLYYRLCFRGTDPLDEEFERTAQEVFGPLMASERIVG
jgi:exodeoxyribonuclease V gamma subunit